MMRGHHAGSLRLRKSTTSSQADFISLLILSVLAISSISSVAALSVVPRSLSRAPNQRVPTLNRRDDLLFVSDPASPVNVYNLTSSPPVATGLTDYGVQKLSGTAKAYEEKISQVVGSAVIYKIAAYNATPVEYSSPYGAGLQLNVMLGVNTTSGRYVYWLQNTLTLDTNNDTAYLVDNIWNDSFGSAQLSNSTVKGTGDVSFSGPPENSTFYASNSSIFSYAMPESLSMNIVVSRIGRSVAVAFGYRAAVRGAQLPSTTSYYDNATIVETATVVSAAMVVDGNKMTPDGYFFDAEFVFGGDTNGALTTFTSMSSTINLAYVLANGDLARPIALYEFGSDTAEAAYNLQVSRVEDGFHVGLGKVDFGQVYYVSALSSIVVKCKASSISVGASTKCTARVSGTNPTGTVTFTSDARGVFLTDNGSGNATSFTWKLSKGSCSVKYKPTSASSVASLTASYSGDDVNNASIGTFSLSVTQKTSKVSVSCEPKSVSAGSSTTCMVAVKGYSPTGTVTWSQTGTGSVTFSSNTCTLTKGSCSVAMTGTGLGKVTIQATYRGDANNSSNSGTRDLTVK